MLSNFRKSFGQKILRDTCRESLIKKVINFYAAGSAFRSFWIFQIIIESFLITFSAYFVRTVIHRCERVFFEMV